MKYTSGQEFLDDPHKCVALLGLSGVGKTTACRSLPSSEWFHYSVDYRIWTHYLGDQLNDYLKSLALEQPLLRELLRKDAITVKHRVHFDNLFATSVFMGMLGDPQRRGSTEAAFRERMAEHARAEIAAMLDVPQFHTRAEQMYGYPHFVMDTSGSLCEVVELDTPDDALLRLLDERCLVLYIEASEVHTDELLRRNADDPKPIYYRPDFIDAELPGLLAEYGAKSVEVLDPRDVGRYLYPRILRHRVLRYEQIADKTGYRIGMTELLDGLHTQTLPELIAAVIDGQQL